MLYVLSFIFLFVSLATVLMGYLLEEKETTKRGRHMFYAFVISFLLAYVIDMILQTFSGCECVLT